MDNIDKKMESVSKTAFISYAREDEAQAEKLYKDLKEFGIRPWRDRENIKGGQNWKLSVKKAIKANRYFLPLFSKNSTKKIGEVQREFKYAIENAKKIPQSEIYIIPVRLDDVQIPFAELEEIHYIDLFPNWKRGINQILISMGADMNQKGEISNKERWKMGITDKDWKELLNQLHQGLCIPFIGSGIYNLGIEEQFLVPTSKEIMNKWMEEMKEYGYPLEDLYELSKAHISEDTYLLAKLAQFMSLESEEGENYPKKMLSDLLNEVNLETYISQFKDFSPYDFLASIDFPLYLTTNYDNFLENTLTKTKEPEREICKWNEDLVNYHKRFEIQSVFDDAQYSPSIKQPLVYHILGDTTLPQSMVLTERDYFEYVIYLNKYDEKFVIPALIRKRLGLSSLLFIGYKIDDLNFRVIFQGFLSFLKGLPEEYRKVSIAVQVPPVISIEEQVKIQRYLDLYTKNMFNVRIFWGSTLDFLKEFKTRWEIFKKDKLVAKTSKG